MRSIVTIGIIMFATYVQAQTPTTTPVQINANTEGHELITKMLNHVDKVNYQGTFVFMHNGQLDSMRIVHGVVDGEVKERLTSLSGEPREVVRDDETVTCVWPMRNLVTVDPSSAHHGIPTIVPRELESLTQNYTVISGSVSRIAEHDCKVLAIKPIDQFRYGYELCIEPESGMLLRSKMIHPRGHLLEEVMFTNVQYLESVDHINFHPENDIEGFTWRKSKHPGEKAQIQQNYEKSWRVSKLPPGFSVSKISQRLMTTSDEPVHHMVVSDGVASVSVFIIKPRKLSKMFEGLSRRGSINAFSRGFDNHQITVLGEVPNETVKMIGSSIVHGEQ
ncbi:MAG: MucB/RseB C-terminal domain-containing protein [Gammaproteobacteria bacterium]|nr:MucB/RseB C-terminal domain-containing protein [Gammaproteobacteria bacterium]